MIVSKPKSKRSNHLKSLAKKKKKFKEEKNDDPHFFRIAKTLKDAVTKKHILIQTLSKLDLPPPPPLNLESVFYYVCISVKASLPSEIQIFLSSGKELL